MSDDRTKADKDREARQEAARYRIFNAATNGRRSLRGLWEIDGMVKVVEACEVTRGG